MSSTNRGAIKNKFGYYYTPIPTIKEFWEAFCNVENKTLNDFPIILDPAAGGDNERPCAYPTALRQFDLEPDDQVADMRFWTVDIRQDSKATYKVDYFSQSFGVFPLIITNPDFELFEQYVEKAITELEPKGYLALLLRLNAAGGQKRKTRFWDKYKPKGIYVHTKRPFPDSCEYAHYVWKKNVIETTKFYWV